MRRSASVRLTLLPVLAASVLMGAPQAAAQEALPGMTTPETASPQELDCEHDDPQHPDSRCGHAGHGGTMVPFHGSTFRVVPHHGPGTVCSPSTATFGGFGHFFGTGGT